MRWYRHELNLETIKSQISTLDSNEKHNKFLKNKSKNSHTTGTLHKITSEKYSSITSTRHAPLLLCSNLLIYKVEITHVGKTLLTSLS